jgi:inner membrane protein
MSPEAHLFASWIVAVKTTDNPHDCRLVALAGILPDADGLGLLVDVANHALGRPATFLYPEYHHYLLHGAWGAVLVALGLAGFARDRGRVFLLALVTFHLHLLCDFVGSRGPSPNDLWPIYYLGPLSHHPLWQWTGQWRLDGWQNKLVFLGLFVWAWRLTLARGHSVVGVFNRRADAVVVKVLRGWQQSWRRRWEQRAGP